MERRSANTRLPGVMPGGPALRRRREDANTVWGIRSTRVSRHPLVHDLRTRRLLLLWTPSLCAADPEETLRLALLGGADLVQVREKNATARELLALARRALAIAAPFGVPVLVNDRADVARAARAAGVHLGQDDLSPEQARRVLPPGALVGVSAHSLAQVDRARADLVGFGPMFATPTKPHEPAIGPDALREALRRSAAPLFAI